MIELGFLGTTRVRSDSTDVDSLLARRKPLGILVYLAMEPGSYHGRGLLCGLLWPEVDDARARRSLRVALHALRDHLGSDAVLTRDDGAVGLDADLVTSDVARLRHAIELGNAAEVARLYRGPFMAGFHTGSAPFDRWLDDERVALERESTDAIQQGAVRALESGEPRHAAALAADLLRIRPTDVTAIQTRVEALRTVGAVGRALEDLGRFREHFETELELPAPERIAELEEAIRSVAAEGAAAAPPDAPPAAMRSPPEASAGEPAEPAPGDDGPAAVPAGPAAHAEAPRPTTPSARRVRLPFHRRPSAIGGLLVVAAIAVAGIAWAVQAGPAGDAVQPRPRDPEAVRHVEDARELRARGELMEAVEAYLRAVDVEPDWGEAHLELAMTAKWAGAIDLLHVHLARAQALAEDMGELERLLTLGEDLYARAQVDRAREVYQRALRIDPDGLIANREMAEFEYHWGATVGVSPEAARLRWERVLARMRSRQALLHLARLDARSGDADGVSRRLRDLEAMDAQEELAEVRALDAVMRGTPPASSDDVTLGMVYGVVASRAPAGHREAFLEAVLPRIEDPDLHMLCLLMRAQLALERGRVGEAEAWIERVADGSPGRRDEFLAAALVLPFRPLTPTAAAAMVERLEDRGADPLIGPEPVYLLSPVIYEPRRQFLLQLLRGPSAGPPDTIAVDDPEAAPWAYADQTDALLGTLRARHLVETERDYAAALDVLDRLHGTPDRMYPTILGYAVAHERYWRARALAGLGRDREALDWYRTFPDARGYDLSFMPGVLLERGRLEAKLGMVDDARSSLLRVVELLEEADPEYWVLASEARRELARLGP